MLKVLPQKMIDKNCIVLIMMMGWWLCLYAYLLYVLALNFPWLIFVSGVSFVSIFLVQVLHIILVLVKIFCLCICHVKSSTFWNFNSKHAILNAHDTCIWHVSTQITCTLFLSMILSILNCKFSYFLAFHLFYY